MVRTETPWRVTVTDRRGQTSTYTVTANCARVAKYRAQIERGAEGRARSEDVYRAAPGRAA